MIDPRTRPPAPPALHTARLKLRALGNEDAGDFHPIYTDPVTMKYWSNRPVENREQSRELVRQDVQAVADGAMMVWAVLLDATVIGKCVLFQFSWQNRRAEVGYLLHREFWGQGLMAEAMSEVIRYAFEDLGLHRLEADADKDNRGSIRLLERLGFRREGYFRERWNVYGDWQDSAMFGLLRGDWDARLGG